MDTGIITRAMQQPAMADAARRPALSLEDEYTWTYAELTARTNSYANGLLDRGAKPGDRIGILLLNSLEYIALYLAITKIGCIAVRLNWRLSGEELQFALHDSQTSILCTHDRFLPTVSEIRGQTDVETVVVFRYDQDGDPPAGTLDERELERASSNEPDTPIPDPGDPCMLMYTSGTTGRPKGALWTHDNTMWFAALQTMRWHYDHTSVTISAGPLFHVGAFEDHVLPTLVTGGHGVLTRSGGFSLKRAAEIIRRSRVTDGLIYPFMIYDLVSDPDPSQFDLSSMRRITSGGSPLLPWAVRRFGELFPNIALEQVYGLTEGGAISTVMPAEHVERHPGSAGVPMPLTELCVTQQEDPTKRLAAEEIGEVWVRSPGVCGQYYRRPEANAETFVDGWCRTGDLGKLTEDGFLYLTGRAKDMIISGGENIYPAEIESALTDHPEIKDVAVIGVPDSKYQEAVCAVLVREPGATVDEEQVISYARTRLAGYKRPRHVVFVEELPRNASGKLLKRVLRDEYATLGSVRDEERR